MADTPGSDTPHRTSDADLTAPPATTEFQPAEPLKQAGAEFHAEAADGTSAQGARDGATAGARQAVADGTATLRDQAGDHARGFAETGKARATDTLGQLSELLTDAAGQVDDKLGAQYGQYARTAADRVQSFSSALDGKSVDELLDDARTLVRKSPAVAVGAAAAVGFVVARLLTAGIDQRDA